MLIEIRVVCPHCGGEIHTTLDDAIPRYSVRCAVCRSPVVLAFEGDTRERSLPVQDEEGLPLLMEEDAV